MIAYGLICLQDRLGELDLNLGISKRWKEFSSLLESLKAIEDTQLPALRQAVEFKFISSMTAESQQTLDIVKDSLERMQELLYD